MTSDEREQQIEETKTSIQNRIKEQRKYNKENPKNRSDEKRLIQSYKHGARQNAEQKYLKQLQKAQKDFD